MSSGDIHIDIYESAEKFTEIGAGIGIWKRPWKVLKNLDLADELSKLTAIPTDEDAPSMFACKSIVVTKYLADDNGCLTELAFQMRKSDQPKGFPYYDLVTPSG